MTASLIKSGRLLQRSTSNVHFHDFVYSVGFPVSRPRLRTVMEQAFSLVWLVGLLQTKARPEDCCILLMFPFMVDLLYAARPRGSAPGSDKANNGYA